MICKRCGCGKAFSHTYFHEGKNRYITYCRRCVSERKHMFQLMLNRQTYGYRYKHLSKSSIVFTLPFPLTVEQRQAMFQLKGNRMPGKQLLLHAVCGAGKTEIMAAFIANAVKQGAIIGWSIARRDVVIELAERLKEYFPLTKIIALYQTSPDLKKHGQFIVLTTARLFYYQQYFDYLIIDENDAYPFNISERQQFAAKQSIKQNGVIIHVSATILKKQRKSYDTIVSLTKRFHNNPLPEISFLRCQLTKSIMNKKIDKNLSSILQTYIEKKHPIFLFCSSKQKALAFSKILQKTFEHEEVIYVSSVINNRTELLENVRSGQVKLVVTTTILERGVTFPNVLVVVMDADEPIFDAQTLIQVAGRVGRTFDNPSGEIIFCYSQLVTSAMKKARKYHELANNGEMLFL